MENHINEKSHDLLSKVLQRIDELYQLEDHFQSFLIEGRESYEECFWNTLETKVEPEIEHYLKTENAKLKFHIKSIRKLIESQENQSGSEPLEPYNAPPDWYLDQLVFFAGLFYS